MFSLIMNQYQYICHRLCIARITIEVHEVDSVMLRVNTFRNISADSGGKAVKYPG